VLGKRHRKTEELERKRGAIVTNFGVNVCHCLYGLGILLFLVVMIKW
jgi:hypothetical protein